MGTIRILVVDDHVVVREGLRWMLGTEPDVDIVGEADTAAGALEAMVEIEPDLVLLDILLPDRNGLEALTEMRERFPEVPVLILSMADQPEYVEGAVRAGAAGYLVKNAPSSELLRAIRAEHAGQGYVQSEVTGPLLARFAAEVRPPDPSPALSPREREVIQRAAEGLADKQISVALGISESTVKGYLRQVYEKLGAADRAQAVAIALRARQIE